MCHTRDQLDKYVDAPEKMRAVRRIIVCISLVPVVLLILGFTLLGCYNSDLDMRAESHNDAQRQQQEAVCFVQELLDEEVCDSGMAYSYSAVAIEQCGDVLLSSAYHCGSAADVKQVHTNHTCYIADCELEQFSFEYDSVEWDWSMGDNGALLTFCILSFILSPFSACAAFVWSQPFASVEAFIKALDNGDDFEAPSTGMTGCCGAKTFTLSSEISIEAPADVVFGILTDFTAAGLYAGKYTAYYPTPTLGKVGSTLKWINHTDKMSRVTYMQGTRLHDDRELRVMTRHIRSFGTRTRRLQIIIKADSAKSPIVIFKDTIMWSRGGTTSERHWAKHQLVVLGRALQQRAERVFQGKSLSTQKLDFQDPYAIWAEVQPCI